MYAEIKPTGAHAQYFDAFWYSENLTIVEEVAKILPDSCSDIIIPLSGNNVEPVFAGYMTRYKDTITSPGEKMFGLRFNPGCSYDVIRDDMSQFTDKVVELSAIRKIDFSGLQDDFQEKGKLNFTMLESILKEMMRPPSKVSHAVYALQLIKDHPELLRIEELAIRLGISRRSLEKEFKKRLGMTPKKFTQIARFKKSLKNRGHHFPDLDVDYGYYDQAHFIKEFKKFAGETPDKFFRSSHFYNTEKD